MNGFDPHTGTRQQVLDGVREYAEKYPVELWRNPSGRLTIVAENEGGNNHTCVDLYDLLEWLRLGPKQGRYEDGFVVNFK